MKDKRFNSNPIQAPNQQDEEIDNKVPIIKEKKIE